MLSPSRRSIPAPIFDIHRLKRGALLRSQPVTPLSSNNGDNAVPKPNRTGKIKLSIGAEEVIEYRRIAIRGGQTINPLVKPIEKARMSNLSVNFFKPKCLPSSTLQTQEDDLFLRRMFIPIITITIPKANKAYF